MPIERGLSASGRETVTAGCPPSRRSGADPPPVFFSRRATRVKQGRGVCWKTPRGDVVRSCNTGVASEAGAGWSPLSEAPHTSHGDQRRPPIKRSPRSEFAQCSDGGKVAAPTGEGVELPSTSPALNGG